ncbi:BMC domain-containing protein [Tepidanaerobacter acetatoxydans]|uniref:BMC domain-containing protein n=1 Tax=Tepidanaerobacter acetatoxydans TaxID=499229 RepID=UPI001BD3B61A|nr:BMC domain-containing protein [Tepidanaerobacter acetatoxydans]
MKRKQALGIIETFGFAAAVEAADTAVKAANVKLLGYELAKGGLTTIKVVGDVGAVKAAISAAEASAQKVGKVAAVHVIPRPHDEIDIFIKSKADSIETVPAENKEDANIHKFNESDVKEKKEEEIQEVDQDETSYTCNLCKDPICPRKKGDPHSNCIHYQSENS